MKPLASILTRFLIGSFIALYALPATALVKYEEQTHTLSITGYTTKPQVMSALIMLREHDVSTVVLWGNGGDFYAGLTLGYALKKEGVNVVIPTGKNCISSCAIAALGGKKVMVDGWLLFHRPYIGGMSHSTTIEEHAGQTGIGYIDYTKYILEMGYVLEFMRLQLTDTSPCKFLKIEDSKTLESLKGQPLDKMGGGLQHVNWCYDKTR